MLFLLRMNKQSMSQPKNKPSPNKFIPIVGFLILLVVGAWLILTLIIPIMRGDGLNNFTGAKKELAAKSITNVQHRSTDNKLVWARPIHLKKFVQQLTKKSKPSVSLLAGSI